MAIPLVCSCGKRFKAPDEAAGKRFTCPACQATIVAQPVSQGGASSPAAQPGCPACGVALAPNAVLCITCGYNLRTGQMMSTEKVPAPEPARRAAEPFDEYAPSRAKQESGGNELLMKVGGTVAALVLIVGTLGLAIVGTVRYFSRIESEAAAMALYRNTGDLGVIAEHGKAATAVVLADLANPDSPNREQAIQVVGRIGLPADEVLPLLLPIVRDEKGGGQRTAAVEALGHLGANAKEAIPDLRKMLSSSSSSLQAAAARALGGMGEDARVALPDLMALAKNLEDDTACAAAIDGLVKLKANPKDCLPFIVRAFDEGRSATVKAAAKALVQFGPEHQEVLPSLIGGLQRETKMVIAAETLGSMGPAAKEAVPALVEAKRLANEIRSRRFRAQFDRQFTVTNSVINSAGERRVTSRYSSPRDIRPVPTPELDAIIAALLEIDPSAVTREPAEKPDDSSGDAAEGASGTAAEQADADTEK